PPRCYICSLSSQTIVYKGLLTPWQFPQFYADLRDPSFATTFAVFHRRYSTNTQPSWHLAQPFRYVAHNGEINTIVSNRRWLRAKAAEFRARLTVGSWFPLLEENVSDSASFDNAFELRLLEGLSSEEAMLAMVPPAFEKDPLLSRDVLKRLAIQRARNAIPQRMLAASVTAPTTLVNEPKRVAAAAGWTEDQFKILFSALTRGKEADWSMGDDAPPAFLSALPRTLWDYCKQRFAQVTN